MERVARVFDGAASKGTSRVARTQAATSGRPAHCRPAPVGQQEVSRRCFAMSSGERLFVCSWRSMSSRHPRASDQAHGGLRGDREYAGYHVISLTRGIYDYLEGRCRADAQTEHQTVSIYGTDSYKYARPYRPHAGSLDPFTTEVDLTTCRSTPRLCTNTVITEVIHKYSRRSSHRVDRA